MKDKLSERTLNGYAKTPGIDLVVVVADSDQRDCKVMLSELKDLSARSLAGSNVLFRLAIEEIEAWYFGDRQALQEAFPKSKKAILNRYVQDSPCSTWELLADAIHQGGAAALKRAGFPAIGNAKHSWASKIGPLMSVGANSSPSFNKLCSGLQREISLRSDHGETLISTENSK